MPAVANMNVVSLIYSVRVRIHAFVNVILNKEQVKQYTRQSNHYVDIYECMVYQFMGRLTPADRPAAQSPDAMAVKA